MEQPANSQGAPQVDPQHYDNCAVLAFIGTIIPTVGYFLTSTPGDTGGVATQAVYVFTIGIPIAIVCLIFAISGLKSERFRILAILSLIPYAIIIVMILFSMFKNAFM